ncbi:MAG: PadR family transcriptional regulator [Desulfovibrio sp.]|nr:MAG: PadR family transcriptional regulator [Desulfovibrio sp.]
MSGGAGGGKRDRYVQPSVLMALLEGSSYGYELIQKLSDFGFMRGDAPPGMVYRHLRQMEEEGMVSSQWDAEGTGPARRNYTITDQGRETLEAWIVFMERQAEAMLAFVERYRNFSAKD